MATTCATDAPASDESRSQPTKQGARTMSNKQAREPGEDDEPESFLPAVLQKFAVLAPGNENIVDILAQNLGGKQLSLFKLEKLGVAAQGMPFFVAKLGDEMEQVKEFDGIVLMMGRNRSFWLKSFNE